MLVWFQLLKDASQHCLRDDQHWPALYHQLVWIWTARTPALLISYDILRLLFLLYNILPKIRKELSGCYFDSNDDIIATRDHFLVGQWPIFVEVSVNSTKMIPECSMTTELCKCRRGLCWKINFNSKIDFFYLRFNTTDTQLSVSNCTTFVQLSCWHYCCCCTNHFDTLNREPADLRPADLLPLKGFFSLNLY